MLGLFFLLVAFSESVHCNCKEPRCQKNERYVVDDVSCLKTCGNRLLPREHKGACKPYTGCVCDKGYVRQNDDFTGPCIREEHCQPRCQKNERYVVDDVSYLKTCGNRLLPREHKGACKPYTGCVCDKGYVRQNDDFTGPCIREEHCPNSSEKCGINEVYSKCKYICPPQTCASLNVFHSCVTPIEFVSGCNCKEGFLRNSENMCIPSDQCPHSSCSDPNASPQKCASFCQPTCAQPDTSDVICVQACIQGGCVCNPGYILDKAGGNCIRKKDCPKTPPPKCGPYEVASKCAIQCPPQTCESIYRLYKCNSNITCTPGCDCIDGYLRDKNGVCIPSEKCPAQPPICGENEVASDCAIQCPPQTCESIYSSYFCDPDFECTPGCDCRDGYLRDRSGVCIPSDKCPVQPPICGENEVASDCAIQCPPQTCESIYSSYFCDPNFECTPGCDCRDGYLRDRSGVCIPSDKCPAPLPICGENEVASDCAIQCPPQTCESIYSSYFCDPNFECTPGCDCRDGYLRDRNGVCIPSEFCSDNSQCNGDRNATSVVCPRACPPTCADADISKPCPAICLETGCQCKENYILEELGGQCIAPSDCPGGSPICTGNKTYVNCYVGCPTEYCPNDDGRAIIACSIAFPCPAGCACNPGYLISSYEDPRCILASDCPPVNCTRPNEVWDPNPTKCYQETCEDIHRDCRGPYPSPPRCVCQPGYVRNENDICVPDSICGPQKCSDPNASPQNCPSSCQPTCAQPDTSNVTCITACLPGGCVCNPGYILDKDGGTCIKKEHCPNTQTCSDPNASPQNCPSSCQPTCAQPDTSNIPCITACLPGGCVCNPGYILDKDGGTCIKKEHCPNTQTCSDPNASPQNCPSFCQPTCAQPDTSNVPCITACLPGGCVCNPGYILDKDGGTCIKKEHCPNTQTCSDPNASPQNCPSSCQPTCAQPDTSNVPCIAACLPGGCVCNPGYILDKRGGTCIKKEHCPNTRTCSDPNASPEDCPSSCQPTCAIPDTRNITCNKACLPGGCVCNPGYILNVTGGICIKGEECPAGCNNDPNAVYDECPSSCPLTCDEPSRRGKACIQLCNPTKCSCKAGYILSKNGCVLPKDCPKTGQCNGDQNATISECPSACQASCAAPDTDRPCLAICLPVDCVCDRGYLLKGPDGPCVLPQDCPGGVPTCGANKTYVPCKYGCPTNYCPNSDSRGIVACSPPFVCNPGCKCNEGYLMLSYEDQRCVLASECPPVKCTRKNEIWDPTPTSCFPEKCGDRKKPCTGPYIPKGTPRCVCKPGYCRNNDDICVREHKCRT